MATKQEQRQARIATGVGAILIVLVLIGSTAAIASLQAELEEGIGAGGIPEGSPIFSTDSPAAMSATRDPAFMPRSCAPFTPQDLGGLTYGPVSVGDGQGMSFSVVTVPFCPFFLAQTLWFDTGIPLGQLFAQGAESYSLQFTHDGGVFFEIFQYVTSVGHVPPASGALTTDALGRGGLIQRPSCEPPSGQNIKLTQWTNRSFCIDWVTAAGMFPDHTLVFDIAGSSFGSVIFPPAGTNWEVDFTIFGTPANATLAAGGLFDLVTPTTFMAVMAWIVAGTMMVATFWLAPSTLFLPKSGGRRSKR